MVLPSHIPPLAWAEGLCGGRGRAAGPAAEPPKRTSGSLARRTGGRPAARMPAPCRGAAGIDFWRRKACALLAFLCRDTFFRKNFDFLLHFRRDLRYIG